MRSLGYSKSEIARALGRAESTVRAYHKRRKPRPDVTSWLSSPCDAGDSCEDHDGTCTAVV